MAFPDTQWTLIANATLTGDPRGQQALVELFKRYEAPILKFIELRTRNAETAKDLSQSFWLHLLEKRTWRQAESERGRFRTFLLAVLGNFLNDQYRKNAAEKRGGTAATEPHDFEETPDPAFFHASQEFDREWAECLLRDALAELELVYAKAGKTPLFTVLRGFLPGATATPSYEDAARQAGVSLDVLRVEVHRMRTRLKDLLRRTIAHTVSTPDQVDEELGYLRKVLAGKS